MKKIAIICDCDNTLAPDTTSLLLESNGIDTKQFWPVIENLVREGWDPPIAWMTEICNLIQDGKISQNTNQKLAEFGKTIEPFPGVVDLLPELNSMLQEKGLDASVEGFVVSSGFEDLMKGTRLSETFTDIFGGRFYEKDGKIAGIKSAVTFTEKTKFIFAVNKGIMSKIRTEPYRVNELIASEKQVIPFENMIYLGDGPSDIPCFSTIKKQGGTCIGIDVGKEWHKEFEKQLREREVTSFKPDYTKESDLYNKLKFLITEMANGY